MIPKSAISHVRTVMSVTAKMLPLAVGISLLANLYFGWSALKYRSHPPTAAPSASSLPLSPFLAMKDRGKPTFVSYQSLSTPTVLYFVAPNCSRCNSAAPAVRDLAKTFAGQYQFIGISQSRDDLRLLQREYPFPVYSVDASDIKSYKIDGLPSLLVIAPPGVIKQRWTGAYGLASPQVLHNWLSAVGDANGT